MKVCTVCKKEKPLEAFQKEAKRKTGYRNRCKSCVQEKVSEWHKNNKERSREHGRKTAYARKIKVLTYYSKDETPVCACNGCSVRDPLFLALDHINGDGAAHRRKEKITSAHLYNWVVKNNFPEGFQVLCHNCNFAKSTNISCPVHKEIFVFTFNENSTLGCRIGV